MRLTALITTLFLSATLHAATLELDRASLAMSGMEASFTHSFTPKGFKKSQSESGSVIFGKLPAMRWTYTKPEQKLFVFDGSRSWFYVPGDKQVTVGRVDDAKKRELPFLLLGDASAREKYFTVREKMTGGALVTTLAPRTANALVRAASVTINPTTHRISRIDYTDREGNRTTFDFSGYHARAAAADTFRFSPPAGVQVINAQ
jgi:outer membrane lipoprotein carrier protein